MTNLFKAWIVTIGTVALAAMLGGCGGESAHDCGSEDPGMEEEMGDVHETSPDGSTGTAVSPDGGAEAPPADGGPSTGDAGGGTDTHPADGGTGGTGGTDGGPSTGDAGAPSSDGGGSSPDAGGSTPDAGGTDAGPTPGAAPFRTPAACQLEFSRVYVGNSPCGEVRGTLPSMTWSVGLPVSDANADSYLELTYASIASGTYEVSYLARTCGGATGAWADFGASSDLLAMTPAARAFLNCNWWNAATETTVSVSSPSCNIRFSVGAGCAITPAGNMQNYHE